MSLSTRDFKVVIVGDAGAGKTALMQRYTKNKFSDEYEATKCVDFGTKTLSIGNESVRMAVWDVPGQESLRFLAQAYYRGSNAMLLAYDVTDPCALQNAEQWLKEIRNIDEFRVCVFLVGTKKDLVNADESKRQVSADDAKKLANKYHTAPHPVLFLTEVSVKENIGVETLFNNLAQFILADISNAKAPASFWNISQNNAGKRAAALTVGALIGAGIIIAILFWPMIATAAVSTLVIGAISAVVGVAVTAYFVGLGAAHRFGLTSPARVLDNNNDTPVGTYANNFAPENVFNPLSENVNRPSKPTSPSGKQGQGVDNPSAMQKHTKSNVSHSASSSSRLENSESASGMSFGSRRD